MELRAVAITVRYGSAIGSGVLVVLVVLVLVVLVVLVVVVGRVGAGGCELVDVPRTAVVVVSVAAQPAPATPNATSPATNSRRCTCPPYFGRLASR